MTTEINNEDTVRQVVERLVTKFPGVDHDEIESVARSEFDAMAGRPVQAYLSILTERAAGKRLKKQKALAVSTAATGTGTSPAAM